ncbi:hypothetical protein PsYK624_111350 [Phanerochaete sordida]|uniref:Uncharacterized protein n=1 Tax=Phanerochaete sordida TaxID=48140 RepID=A0A9P3LHT0_9APHY|nr:hypothetical protein PsYK624_111350 [Phanerochaete sordida]
MFDVEEAKIYAQSHPNVFTGLVLNTSTFGMSATSSASSSASLTSSSPSLTSSTSSASSTSSTTPTTATAATTSSKSHVGAIVGGVVGGVAAALLGAVVVVWLLRQRKHPTGEQRSMHEASRAFLSESFAPSSPGQAVTKAKLYDPDDPATFPGMPTLPAGLGTSAQDTLRTVSAPSGGPLGYTGVAEI